MEYLRVIDDHVVVGDSRRLILFSDLSESVEEQAVSELHDVRLVDTGNFLEVKTQVSSVVLTGLPKLRAFLLFLRAKSKAKREIRSALARVETLRLSTTPGKLWCSNPEYSPSVFSRMMAKSTLLWRVGAPRMDLQTTTEA